MADQPRLELTGSRLFTAWLASARASLAFTTYQAGKLFLIGLKADGRLSIFERTFSRSMGLGTGSGGTLWMSSTLAGIVGAKMPDDRPIDGVDQIDVLLGKR